MRTILEETGLIPRTILEDTDLLTLTLLTGSLVLTLEELMESLDKQTLLGLIEFSAQTTQVYTFWLVYKGLLTQVELHTELQAFIFESKGGKSFC